MNTSHLDVQLQRKERLQICRLSGCRPIHSRSDLTSKYVADRSLGKTGLQYITIIVFIHHILLWVIILVSDIRTWENKEKKEKHILFTVIWLWTILIVRKETCCRHIGYSFRLTARVLLYAPSHRQDSTYHGLYYTSRGALAGTRNSPMGEHKERKKES